MNACIGEQKWLAAEFHLNALMASEQDAGRLAQWRHQRGHVRAAQARWSAAAEDYSHPAPGALAAGTLYCRAILALELGDLVAYDRTCGEAIAQFRDTKNPLDANTVAWMCALGPRQRSLERDRSNRAERAEPDSIPATSNQPDSASDPAATSHIEVAIALAEFAIRTEPQERSYTNTLAFALLRAGRTEVAVAKFKKSLAQNEYPEDYAGLALCYHRLNQSKLAWEQAEQWKTALNRKTQPGQSRPTTWHEQLSRQLLDRELKGVQHEF